MGGKSSKKEDINNESGDVDKGKDGKEAPNKEKEDKAPPVPPVSYLSLFRYTNGFEKFLLAIAAVSCLVSGASMPVMVIFFGRVSQALIDNDLGEAAILASCPGSNSTTPAPADPSSIDNTKFIDAIEEFGLWMTIIGVAVLALMYIFVTFLNIVAENVAYRIRREYLKALLRQNVGWYDTVQDKNFVSRISEDLVKVQEAIGEKLGLCGFFMSQSVLSLINAFYHGWKLTLVTLSSAPALAIASGIVAGIQTKLAADEQTSYAKAGNVAEEALTNVRTVMAFSGCDKEIQRYENGLGVARSAAKKRGAISAFGGALMWCIIWLSYALAFWYGTKLILEGRDAPCRGEEPDYDAQKLLIVFFSVLIGAFNIGQSASYFEAFAVGRGSAAIIYSILERKPEIDSYSEEGKKPSKKSTGTISFHDIEFRYPSRPDVQILKKFSLSISPGQTVALVGHSGCGKSTILQLLQRFYDPINGKVCVDGEDIKNLHLGWLRSQIGVVSQEPVLFNTTILENIKYGRDGVTQEEVEAACKQSNAHGFISKLPLGYKTLVGDRGTQLSGGQKQRIAIARALVRNPSILLLDEATSALDTQSESVVQAALDQARKGRTTLIVAHRLSTIRSADLVVSINDGAVVEKGTHKELLANKGLYHGLVTAQMSGRGETDLVDEESDDEETATRKKAKQADLDRSLEEMRRRASVKLDDEEVLALGNAVSDELIEELELANEAPITRLLKLNMPEKWSILLGIVSSMVQGSLIPLYAVLFGDFLGTLSNPDRDEAEKSANSLALWFVALGVAAGVSMFLLMYMFTLAGEALTARLRRMTFYSMLQQELGWYDDPNNNVGALCSRLSGDCAHVQGATGSRIGSVVQSITTIAVGIGLSLYYDARLGAVASVFMPFVVIATYYQMRLMTGQNISEKKAVDEASKIAVQSVGNIRTVASLCKERRFVEMYEEKLVDSHMQVKKLAHLRGFIFGFAQSCPFFAYAAVMYYGGWLVQNDGLAYDKVFKVGEALVFGTMMVGQTMAFAPNYNKAKVSGARILRLLDRIPAIRSPLGSSPKMTKGKEAIGFDQVGFSYPTRPTAKILKCLSYEVKPGQSIALVGPSGCGKSTCIQLILRYYDPSSGRVTINEDKSDVKDMNLDALRSQMAIVAQEPALFDRTIGQNIAYGDNSRDVPMDEIISAAKQANIHTFISSLPAGYETRVGEMGTQLSGGQKQRVAIARALVRKPKILLLDEATSALDTESEGVVQAALDAAASGRTSISIAHRLSSIQGVDRILVINQGELYESGTHAELLEKQGLYYRLWSMQGQHSGN